MDLGFSAQELAFRDEVRDFVAANLPADIAARVFDHRPLDRSDHMRWADALAARGWLAGHWPVEHGGLGWSAVQSYLFDVETSVAGAPPTVHMGVSMLAPVLMRFGTPEQQARFLPRIRANLDFWCQGYSEPGAGSDLASLRTRARRDGDVYRVDGQKTWTTMAHWADWIFCLVRTGEGARPQEGISFLLIDLRSPGVTVRPIVMADGQHYVNDVFLDDVVVPVANRVGDEGQGWTCAKYLLGHERAAIAGVGASRRELATLRRIAAQERRDGRALAHDPVFAARIAQVAIELQALEWTLLRMLTRRGGAPGPEASLLKVMGAGIQQTISELMLDAAGPAALPWIPEAMHGEDVGLPAWPSYASTLAGRYFAWRKLSIVGGTDEVQRGIVARQAVGL